MNRNCNRIKSKVFLILISIVVLLCSLLLPNSTYSQVDTFEFDTEEQQDRFRTLSDELRCPMCQNSSLSGSTGGVAEDLRREVYRMIMEGMSDSEINSVYVRALWRLYSISSAANRRNSIFMVWALAVSFYRRSICLWNLAAG